MFILFYFNIFILLFIFNYVHTQQIDDTNKICNKLNIDSLFRNINFTQLDLTVNQQLVNNLYPMNDRQILDSVVRNENPCPFREKVLQKMARKETIKIAVLGGSNTMGSGVTKPSKSQGRWSGILDRLLNSGWYKGNFEIYNLGRGGWSISSWNEDLIDVAHLHPDFIIGDFTVNDGARSEAVLNDHYDTFIKLIETFDNRPAMFFYITFHLCEKNGETSAVKNYIHKVSFKNSKLYGFYPYWVIADFAKNVIEKYNVPYSSYRDVVYPDFFSPPDNIVHFWSHTIHPNETTHKYMADHIFSSFTYLLKDSMITNKCHKELSGKKNILNYCDRPSFVHPKDYDPLIRPICLPNELLNYMESENETSISTFNFASSFNINTSKWKYFADSKEKFGLIYDTSSISNVKPLIDFSDVKAYKFQKNISMKDLPLDSLLSFNITTNNILQLTYLKSYSYYFGGFLAWLDDNLHSAVFIKTRWPEGFSLPDNFFFLFDEVKIHKNLIKEQIKLKNISKGNHILNIFPTPVTSSSSQIKVKIMKIISC